MALLIAMHLVLTRVLVIDLGAYRISVGSVCTILAGLWLGPVAGGVCGLSLIHIFLIITIKAGKVLIGRQKDFLSEIFGIKWIRCV